VVGILFRTARCRSWRDMWFLNLPFENRKNPFFIFGAWVFKKVKYFDGLAVVRFCELWYIEGSM
jgi:hypothetical protein